MLYLFLEGGIGALNSLPFTSWGTLNSFTLTAIPLFLLMAEVLGESGLSTRVYRALGRLVAFLPGGLLQTNIAGCAIFASVSGSSIAPAASSSALPFRPTATSRCRPARSPPVHARHSAEPGDGHLQRHDRDIDPQLFMPAWYPASAGGVVHGPHRHPLRDEPTLAPRDRERLGDRYLPLIEIVPFLVIIVSSLGALLAG
jgi:hypothetical protein